ncbi:MAG: hypothetical protein JWM50_2043 [Microbacteriaceae bacterium]|jgi:hypothetical protein|nr:hypothetical protein [Microbacteriaceae bacterium]
MVVLAFGVGAAIAFPLLVVAFRMLDDAPVSAPVILGFSLMFAALTASLACLVALLRLGRCARARIHGAFPPGDPVTDVVVKGRDGELSLDDRVLATKCAVALLPYLAFQQAQLVLLCAGLLLSQLTMAISASTGPNRLALVGAVLVVVAIAGSVALWVVQSRRVRRFLEANRWLLGVAAG